MHARIVFMSPFEFPEHFTFNMSNIIEQYKFTEKEVAGGLHLDCLVSICRPCVCDRAHDIHHGVQLSESRSRRLISSMNTRSTLEL